MPTDLRAWARPLTPSPRAVQLRIYRIWSFQGILERSTALPFFYIIIVRNVLLVLTVTHIFACIFFFITYYDYYARFETLDGAAYDAALASEYEEETWFGVEPAVFVREWSTGERYLRALYWSMTTFTTVGYGDFSPRTLVEQGFVTVRPPPPPPPQALPRLLDPGSLGGLPAHMASSRSFVAVRRRGVVCAGRSRRGCARQQGAALQSACGGAERMHTQPGQARGDMRAPALLRFSCAVAAFDSDPCRALQRPPALAATGVCAQSGCEQGLPCTAVSRVNNIALSLTVPMTSLDKHGG